MYSSRSEGFRSSCAAGILATLFFVLALMLPATGNAAIFGKAPEPASPAGNPAGSAQSAGQSPYIVGGSESNFERHPWLVQITLNGGAFCGGALVHPMLVLTAAHCLWSAENGNWWGNLGFMQAFTGRTLSGTGGEQLNIAGWGIATNYQPLDAGLSGENDYGLLALSSPSSRPVLKIAGSNERAVWRAGRSALVAGFGNISQGGAASPVLKELTVPILDDSVCASGNSYGTAFFASNMLCSGIVQGGSGTCQGDSGGALTVPVDGGGRRIVGVVSWGDGCAKPNKPTLYARVAEPAIATQVNALAAQAGQAFNFPGVNADTNLLGSGAKPAGCSAAQSALAKAQAAVNKASKSAQKASKSAKRAAAKVKRARGAAKAKARKAASAANRKSKKAKAKLAKLKKQAKATRTLTNAVCN